MERGGEEGGEDWGDREREGDEVGEKGGEGFKRSIGKGVIRDKKYLLDKVINRG